MSTFGQHTPTAICAEEQLGSQNAAKQRTVCTIRTDLYLDCKVNHRIPLLARFSEMTTSVGIAASFCSWGLFEVSVKHQG
mmetsp:Transcript_12498/g.28988  ORF Transcript_12498/g.28988 Transcript_12498/m.28988 type:complete len:80 (-) Transcript_12498:1574-1813(-)